MDVKPGIKTTELWLAIAVIALDTAGALSGILPPEWAATLATGTAALYKIVRMFTKMGVGSGATDPYIQEIVKRLETMEATPPGGTTNG